ncbi:SRPBCC family protein [Micromonospora sp. WMMD882]|uniref:SRPBCC family protein n=1 Tax=Micromonospora sp. WMMD882 TaxID=3015151 RepID=UPI00248B6CAA|nr:SRPBCC family protein [Micromonospora sp. WMMD882]WBB79802.1 SRPBCC family protein [Micromonospora sp. WMMD882]
MILVERSAHVAAPVEAVWDVVQRAEQLPAWLAGVRAAEVLSGEGYGRRQRVQAGRGAAHEAEVIAYQEPHLIGWRERAKGAGARAEARTEIYVQLTPNEEDEAGGTVVRLIVVRWPAGPVKAALLRLGLRRVGADLEDSLARLTDLAAVG